MKYDEIIASIGGFGRYQIRVIFLMFLSFIPNGLFTMVSVFILDTPDHHCKIDKNTTNNSTVMDERYQNESLGVCKKYSGNETNTSNQSTINCDDGWDYLPKFGETTAVMEWDLVCDRAWIKPVVISCYMAGNLVGGIIGGGLADRFGRRPVFLIGFAMQFATNFFAYFSTGPFVLSIFYCLSGFAGPLNYVGGFVLGTEVIVSSKRAMMGFIASSGYAVGYMILPVFAYFLTDWRWLMFCVGGTGFLYIPYYWLIPESPRWLIINGKSEAEDLIKKIAQTNKMNIDKLDLTVLKVCQEEEAEEVEISKQFTYLDVFKNPITRTRTIFLCCIWFSTVVVYYGVSLGTSNLGGNKFINCFISAAVEIPANLVICLLFYKFGRRNIISAYFIITTMLFLFSTYLGRDKETIRIVSSMVGKFFITGAFTGIYIYSCELFPTKMRQMGMGVIFSFARLGSISAPYIIYAGSNALTITIGIVTFLSSLLILCLPETVHSKLPDTMDDVYKQERYKLDICKFRKKDHTLAEEDKKAEKI